MFAKDNHHYKEENRSAILTHLHVHTHECAVYMYVFAESIAQSFSKFNMQLRPQ